MLDTKLSWRPIVLLNGHCAFGSCQVANQPRNTPGGFGFRGCSVAQTPCSIFWSVLSNSCIEASRGFVILLLSAI